MPSGWWLASYIALWFLLIIESVALIAVIRQLAQLYGHWVQHDAGAGLPVGTAAPAILGTDVFNRPVSLASARGRLTVLYFLSPGCSSCSVALEQIPELSRTTGIEAILILNAKPDQTRLYVAQFSPETTLQNIAVMADPKREWAQKYRVNSVPYVVIVDSEGYIGDIGTGMTVIDTETLILRAQARQRRRWEQEGKVLPLLPREDKVEDKMVVEAIVR